jgi:hypothetical protein
MSASLGVGLLFRDAAEAIRLTAIAILVYFELLDSHR